MHCRYTALSVAGDKTRVEKVHLQQSHATPVSLPSSEISVLRFFFGVKRLSRIDLITAQDDKVGKAWNIATKLGHNFFSSYSIFGTKYSRNLPCNQITQHRHRIGQH